MYKHILIPIAPEHVKESAERLAIAQGLLADGGRISVLTILEELPSYIGSYFPEDQMQQSLTEMAGSLATEISTDAVSTHVVAGHPTHSILGWAEQNACDCIIVSSHRRPGLSDYLLGSTAARVVRHANCTVVVVR